MANELNLTNLYIMPNVETLSFAPKQECNTSKLKVLLLTRDNLWKRFADISIEELETRHIDKSLHPEIYYSDVVLFCDPHLTRIMKAPVKLDHYIHTEDVTYFLKLITEDEGPNT
jgi:hypothetical protein